MTTYLKVAPILGPIASPSVEWVWAPNFERHLAVCRQCGLTVGVGVHSTDECDEIVADRRFANDVDSW